MSNVSPSTGVSRIKAIISGLTCSGKTSTAKELARRAGVEYFSGSAFRAERLGLTLSERSDEHRAFWGSDQRSIMADTARLTAGGIERSIDLDMLQMYQNAPSGVFDVWFIAWLTNGDPGLRVWLATPDGMRRDRLAEGGGQLAWADAVRKDTASIAFAKSEYAIDMRDLSCFDVIVTPLRDTSLCDVCKAVEISWKLHVGQRVVIPAETARILTRPSADAAPAT